MRPLAEVVNYLDERFRLDSYAPDTPFSKVVPAAYEQDGRRARDLLAPRFFPRCSGLMLASGAHVRRVYLAVFVSDEIVRAIAAREEEGESLIFAHHPVEMETSGRGFLPLSPDALDTLRERGISVYALHNALDRDAFISTNRALARRLGLRSLRPFTEDGVVGQLAEPSPVERFLRDVASVLGLPEVNAVVRTDVVRTVAVVAGGGSNQRYPRLAVQEGADLYLTGTYDNQIQNEVGERHRRELEVFLGEKHRLTLVEGSHYATEAVVLKEDMALLFERELGVETCFVAQSDAWH